jgi:hypothetical protein
MIQLKALSGWPGAWQNINKVSNLVKLSYLAVLYVRLNVHLKQPSTPILVRLGLWTFRLPKKIQYLAIM